MNNDEISLGLRNKWSDALSMSHLNKRMSQKKKGPKQSATKSLEQSLKSHKMSGALVPINTFGDTVVLRNAQKNFTLLERYTYNIAIESPIYEVKSLDVLDLDLSKTLSYKKGDLNLIQSNTVRCRMKDPTLETTKLVIKRLDCLDQNVYNLKIHETETMQRLGQNVSIVKLYSYWQETPDNPFIYRSLYQLFEECVLGDLESTVLCSALQPSKRTVIKYACGIAKGLFAYHQIGLVHGGIRPNNILLNENNGTLIGAAKKTE
jgi:serine/threonine protein kinase